MSADFHIQVEDLQKSFRIAQRQAGFTGAIKGLFSREYRDVNALENVQFNIARGELVGYIGPNGAGKSTTIKILSGILVPSAGRCLVNGLVPWVQRKAHVANIGVVFGQRTQLWWDLPVIESFDLLARIYRLSQSDYQKTKDELIQTMDISSILDTPVRQLSLGQRMRCDIVASMLHQPSILFLDEPTIGLDAVSKLAVREFISRLNAEKQVTVILTTHDMDDIEALCNRIIVIADGTILSDGTLAQLRHSVNSERSLTLELDAHASFASIAGVRLLSQEGNSYHLSFDPGLVSATTVIRQLVETHEIKDILIGHMPVEQLIADLYRKGLK